MRKFCRNCKFFNSVFGECRKKSPGKHGFPSVCQDDCCGEWEARRKHYKEIDADDFSWWTKEFIERMPSDYLMHLLLQVAHQIPDVRTSGDCLAVIRKVHTICFEIDNLLRFNKPLNRDLFK